VRNFGGPELLSRMAKSTLSGRGSVDGALRALNGMGVDTTYALSRFAEALLYSSDNKPEGGLTFDQSVTATINSVPAYTFYGFDIYDRKFPGLAPREYKDLSTYPAPLNTVQLYVDTDNWTDEIAKNNGKLDVRLLRVDPDADYYMMTRPKPKQK
jgi:hypothetical protein